jgi:cell division protein FtsL
MNRPHTLAFVSERFLFIAALLSAIVLILSAGALVTTQYRVRLLFVEIDVARKLADDSSQLALDLSKAALPAAVSRRAGEMGFIAADVNNTVLFEVEPQVLLKEHMEVRK